jgi:hypothetical protein
MSICCLQSILKHPLTLIKAHFSLPTKIPSTIKRQKRDFLEIVEINQLFKVNLTFNWLKRETESQMGVEQRE